MMFDVGGNSMTVLDTIVEDGKHYLTRKRFNRNNDTILAGFSEDKWACIDSGRGSTASRGPYC